MTISVAMCTYNGARFLDQQLESIAAQTRLPAELVVSDDASTDATPELLRRFADRAPFPVRLLRNDTRIGSTKNFEKAIGHCTGAVIALADQDDVWHPDKLARIDATFSEKPRCGLVFSDARLIDEGGVVGERTLWQHIGFSAARREGFVDDGAFESLAVRNVVTGATMAFRSELREEILPIPGEGKMVHDRWIALIAAAIGEICPLDETLIDYRRHGSQQIGAGVEVGGVAQWLKMGRQTASTDFALWAMQLTLVRDRLHHLGDRVSTQRLERLDARIRHLETRATMPNQALRRIPRVISELVSLRYHRYSNHLWSALKDLTGVGERKG